MSDLAVILVSLLIGAILAEFAFWLFGKGGAECMI